MKVKILLMTFAALSALLLSSCNSVINPLGSKGTPSLFPILQGGKIGYINRTGEVIIQPQFKTHPLFAFFSEGFASACIESGKCGYIDETGKFIINPQFTIAMRFSEGLAAVVIDNKLGFIDKTGKFAINPQFESSGDLAIFSSFSGGMAAVKIGDKYGFVDKTGIIVINPQFESTLPFFDNLAAVKIGSKWGFIDKDGKIIINPQFDEADYFINGLAVVRIGKQFGYVDGTGNILINPQFDNAMPFSDEGVAMIQVGQKTGFIDKDGKYVINPQFTSEQYISSRYQNFGFAVSSELGRFSFSEGLSPVKMGENTGYVDKTGKIVINPQFGMAFPFFNGLAIVFSKNNSLGPGLLSGNEMAYIDKEGKYVWRETRETPKTSSKTAANTMANAANAMANAANTMANAANAAPRTSSSSNRTGRLATDSNIRSEPNKNAASLGIHFKGAKVRILDETSYTVENGEISTWFKVRITVYGCSVNANLGCGKNNSNDKDEGWLNAKGVLLD